MLYSLETSCFVFDFPSSPGFAFNADVSKIVPMRPPTSEHNIPDVLVGHGATGIIATESRPTKDQVLLGVELLKGTIGKDIRIADLRHSREFLESRETTVEADTTIIVTTEGDIITATISKRSGMVAGPDPEKQLYLLKDEILISTHQTRSGGYHVWNINPGIQGRVHLAVLCSFRGGPTGKLRRYTGDHANRDKDDNRIVNIFWEDE